VSREGLARGGRLYVGRVAGALPEAEYLGLNRAAGLEGIHLLGGLIRRLVSDDPKGAAGPSRQERPASRAKRPSG
jgi:hypothetical protein